MASRDLTSEFVSQRKRFAASQPDAKQLPSDLPPPWVDLADQLKQDLAVVKLSAQQLEVLQRDRLRSIFENDETATREAAIQKLGLAVGQALRGVESKLVRLAPSAKEQQGLHWQERVVRINAQKCFSTRLLPIARATAEATARYNTALALLKGETEPLGRRLPLRTAGSALGLGAGDTDSKRAPSSGEGYALLQDQHQEDVSMASSKDSERRYQEILTLAQSVQDLASLQNRLNVMIVEQGEYLDRIDEHIERAKEQVISGKNELVKAREDDVKNKKRTTVVGGFLLGAIAILGTILGTKR